MTESNNKSAEAQDVPEGSIVDGSRYMERVAQLVPLTQLVLSDERRARVNEVVVVKLMDSIERRGLFYPIRATNDYVVGPGAHRFVAHERLGRAEILVIFVDGDEVELELDELEENLARRELTVLERAIGEKRLKELYLGRNPGTRAGLAGALARVGQQPNTTSFAEGRAKQTGESTRLVQQRIQIASNLAPEEIARLTDHPVADNHKQLLKLARLPSVDRAEAIDRLVSEPSARVVDSSSEQTPQESYAKLLANLSPIEAWTTLLRLGETNTLTDRDKAALGAALDYTLFEKEACLRVLQNLMLHIEVVLEERELLWQDILGRVESDEGLTRETLPDCCRLTGSA